MSTDDINEGASMGSTDGATLHVAFGEAAAGSIREALEGLGCREPVVGLRDNLSFGPINPLRFDLRQAWASSVLHMNYDDYGLTAGIADEFWATVTSPEVAPVAWVCMTYASEHAGFLEFAWQMAGRSFDIIDATYIEVPSEHYRNGIYRPWSLGIMSSEEIVASGLHDMRVAFPDAHAQIARERWHRLREENAPFRVLKDGCLVSAPLTYFDPFLLQYATTDWQVATRLIGETMGRMMLDLMPPGQGPSDAVLFGRMLALGEAGILDVEGSGPHMRGYRVRKVVLKLLA